MPPVDAAALLARGNAAMAAADAATAAACYRALLAGHPNDPGLLYNLGNALKVLGDVAGAEAMLRRSLALAPDHAAAHNNLGNLLRADGRAAAALEEYRRALQLAPGDAALRANFGTALMDLMRPDEAVACFVQAVQAMPRDAQARINLAGALMLTRQPREALSEYRAALDLAPDNAGAALGEAIALLTLGEWRAGWDRYEVRFRDPRFTFPAAPAPRWHGHEPLAGRSLLLLAEQGVGDTLQFCRYAPLLAARGARVVLAVHRPLLPLLAGLAATVTAMDDPLPACDLFCPLMSLAHACTTTEATVPPAPYLRADAARLATWRRRLGKPRGLRVGLAWAGNPVHPLDALRSLPESALAPLLALPGIEAHALQPDARPADARIRAHPDITDFADTAALATLMDLVISVDTAVAHLAGALGRPVWILLASAPDFRWMLDRADTPWYPTARLFRATRPRVWDPVIAEVAEALTEWTGCPNRT